MTSKMLIDLSPSKLSDGERLDKLIASKRNGRNAEIVPTAKHESAGGRLEENDRDHGGATCEPNTVDLVSPDKKGSEGS